MADELDRAAVAAYHADLGARVLPGMGQPEAQIALPIEQLIRSMESSLHVQIGVFRETAEPTLNVRPDLGVNVDGLLTGHIELKAPGKGARPSRFTDAHDRRQWEKLRELPNLLLTDGLEWALYRTGERVRASELPPLAPHGVAITVAAAAELSRMIVDFLRWTPVTPRNAEQLATLLAPLTRVVRDEVLEALTRSQSAISQLAKDWRAVLFPDATNDEFADAYAQTLTYALLLARLDPATRSSGILTTFRASEALEGGHALLSQALRVLSEPAARREIATGVGLLERFIGAVDPNAIQGSAGHDVWLYFYEQFLAAYDHDLREQRGAYYTPVEVVNAQVRLVGTLLRERFGKPRAYADDDVILLDPAVGTGTYPLGAIDYGLEQVASHDGPGAVPGRASVLARNVHAFELLVGPYTVAHLRLTQRIRDAGGEVPSEGVHVYLTDTLESPDHALTGQIPLALQRLGVEHERARAIKTHTRVLVCIGNPPYDRQALSEQATATEARTRTMDRLLGPFIELVRGRTRFSHLASLYNLYVYFWRWALWKVFDSTAGPGIVSFITASSYLRGPGFSGMREVMRRTFDELWIIDLGGDNRGTERSENVFAIETPVAIAVGVRYGSPQMDAPADVHYVRVDGDRAVKLAKLESVHTFSDIDDWAETETEWASPFVPTAATAYDAWPDVRDVFPWQTPGIKVGRAWPIGVNPEVLERRWRRFTEASRRERVALMPDRRFGRKTMTKVGETVPIPPTPDALSDLLPGSPMAPIVRYAYRSLVRHYLIADPRLIDLQRPPLWVAHSDRQIYLIGFLTHPIGAGPLANVASLIPDLDVFRGSFGGRHVVPLYRNSAATVPNIAPGLEGRLSEEFGRQVAAEEVFAYASAVLGSERYAQLYRAEMAGTKRLFLTTDPVIFDELVELGRRLIAIETFGDRFGDQAGKPAVPGRARSTVPIPGTMAGYPDTVAWEAASETLRVGSGAIQPVSEAVWTFEFSGLHPLRSWIGYRLRDPLGRHSSKLDDIRPDRWPTAFTDELLELIWSLEKLIDLQLTLTPVIDRLIASPAIPVDLVVPDGLRSGPNPPPRPGFWE